MWRRVIFGMASQEAAMSKVIEVERKFLFQDDITDKLRKLGAEHIQTKTFTDSYFDTRAHVMTLADHWLRQRDGSWQLKRPPSKTLDSRTTTQYVETENESDIIEVLSPILNPEEEHDGKRFKSLSEMIAEFQVKEFARFQTERASYKLGEFMVDLDQADFGYKVGEIEMIVSSEEQVSDTLEKIDVMALDLGLTGCDHVRGKLITFLQKKDPAHLQKLIDNRIAVAKS